MKNLLILLLALTIVLILSALVMGQPGLPGGADGPAQAPIDGGLGLLAAAGGTYAWKKLRDRKKNEDIDL
jgi:hypothetical protein